MWVLGECVCERKYVGMIMRFEWRLLWAGFGQVAKTNFSAQYKYV